MNWHIFELKYCKREQWAFEQMSYLLFCAEFQNKIGLFRYKNQAGIETEPIEKDGKFYGFQSKYYATSIDSNKNDIIDSIRKAKSKNNQLDKLFLYINQEPSESTTKSKKKPTYLLEIEKAASKEGISIQWRGPSHFERQLSLPENKDIYDMFFSLDPNEGDLLDEISKHNENILQAIQTEITFGDKQIKIDRSSVIEAIAEASKNKKNIIISGEGGCGKTAIFKEFYNSYFKKIQMCLFKANELNVNHINDIFHIDHKYTFEQFINAYKEEPLKIFVIDSAEKLAEVSNNDILYTLIQKLKNNAWNIIFTTRYVYLNDLIFYIKENYHLSFYVNDVSLISTEELKSIADEFKFSLPDNKNFIERLKNLFYLREYVQNYSNIDKQGNYKGFIDLLWKKRIQNNVIQNNNLHIEREECIISVVKRRCKTGRFYISSDDLPQSALFQLKQDEILGYDDIHGGYFITHDIYEEWTLDKIVSQSFFNTSTTKEFFDDLGNSLPIRRAFRLWLSNHLSEKNEDIESFIQDAFTNIEITQFWRDEILVSILLSDYSEAFFMFFEKEIIANDFYILRRILFLLRIACTDISAVENIEVVKPKGKGWEETISLIYSYKTVFFDNNIKWALPILTAWCNFNKKGNTTKYSGLLALSLIQRTETEENFFINEEIEEGIFKVVFNSAYELQEELKEIFDRVVANKWRNHNNPYERLCSKILAKPYLALGLIKTLPLSIIQLCNLFWQKREEKENYGHTGYGSEGAYGISGEFGLDYFPASAYQTPIYWLLKNSFEETLNFIIDFTNRAIGSYSKSQYGKNDVKEITLYINEIEVTQYFNIGIWGMHRGILGSVPYLLQSVHMALEKFLLETSHISKPETIEYYLRYILLNSKSASLTAIVNSVILANPEKFYNIAMVLFKTIELFHVDSVRSINEIQARSIYSIGYGLDPLKDIYMKERFKTCEDKHRSLNLESLFVNYQFFGVKNFSEEQNTKFINQLYEIIDNHKKTIPAKSENEQIDLGILLARMDRRIMKPEVKKQDESHFIIELNPQLPAKLRKESELAVNQYNKSNKYIPLNLWSNFTYNKKCSDKNNYCKEYDENPNKALSDTKQLISDLKNKERFLLPMDEYIPCNTCSKLISNYKDVLQKEDKSFCEGIIVSSIRRLLSDDYQCQISDGIEAAIHALPSLIEEYPDKIENYLSIMVLTLFNEAPIGEYKRICDYVIETIRESKLWELNYNVAQSILLRYIKLKPIYKKIVNESRKRQSYYWSPISKNYILKELKKIYNNNVFNNISYSIKDIQLLDIHDLEIVYQLIPSDTKDKIHLNIYAESLPLLASKLLKIRGDCEDNIGDGSNIYKLRLSIFKRFAYFILQREISEIDMYIKPFIDSFSSTEETASFIAELIRVEDYLCNCGQFWYIWSKLYPKIKELCVNTHNYYLKEIIINYLLAWRWWREDVVEWHSLKYDNKSLYTNASKEIGNIPAVLYSTVRVLNSIGTMFKDDGIEWIYNIVSRNGSLDLGDLELSTLRYLETFLRKFVFINRQKIKKEIRLKNKVIPILDFMIERGSIHGYLIRESVI